jgi:hypothetical protein
LFSGNCGTTEISEAISAIFPLIFSVIDKFFAKDIANHNPLASTIGVEDFKMKFMEVLLVGFPDLKWISHEVVNDGHLTVVVRWTLSGTHKGFVHKDLCKIFRGFFWIQRNK